MRGERRGIDAERFDRGERGAQVDAVVASRQRQGGGVHHECIGAMQRVAAQVPAVLAVEPATVAARQVEPGQDRIAISAEFYVAPNSGWYPQA